MRILAIIFVVLAGLAGLAATYRFELAVMALTQDGPPPLRDKGELTATERWFDDYYTIDRIDERTHTIGEPRVGGPTFSYLIEGEDMAVLFDTGLPQADMSKVVAELTDKPLTVIPSHLHYDHVGNITRFDHVAMLDTPETRAQIVDGQFTPRDVQFLGSVEGYEPFTWPVAELLAEGSRIELGGRTLQVIRTPGHTDQSISLWDEENKQLFTGDYIYEGGLYAFLPNSSLVSYLETAEKLLLMLPEDTELLTAHRWRMIGTPILNMQDLVDLRNALEKVRDGELAYEGLFPAVYPVNENLTLETDVPWLRGWD